VRDPEEILIGERPTIGEEVLFGLAELAGGEKALRQGFVGIRERH
jgi:hypothetical protein